MGKTGNQILMEESEKSIYRVVSDQTVDVEETIANLVTIIEKCEIWLDALRSISS